MMHHQHQHQHQHQQQAAFHYRYMLVLFLGHFILENYNFIGRLPVRVLIRASRFDKTAALRCEAALPTIGTPTQACICVPSAEQSELASWRANWRSRSFQPEPEPEEEEQHQEEEEDKTGAFTLSALSSLTCGWAPLCCAVCAWAQNPIKFSLFSHNLVRQTYLNHPPLSPPPNLLHHVFGLLWFALLCCSPIPSVPPPDCGHQQNLLGGALEARFVLPT